MLPAAPVAMPPNSQPMLPFPMTTPGLAGGMVASTALPALMASQQALLPPGLTTLSPFNAIPGFPGLNGVAQGPVAAIRAPVVSGAYAGHPTPPLSPQDVSVLAAAGYDLSAYDGR